MWKFGQIPHHPSCEVEVRIIHKWAGEVISCLFMIPQRSPLAKDKLAGTVDAIAISNLKLSITYLLTTSQ